MSSSGSMSLRAWEWHLRRLAGERAAEADAKRLRQLQREAREPEEQDFVGYVRELADGTANKREKAQQELKKWNRRRLADGLADKLKQTKSMHVAADLLSEVL